MENKNLKEAEMFLQSKTFPDDRVELLERMERIGGNFEQKLAEVLGVADKSNYHIGIKAFWFKLRQYIKKELYDENVYCECGDAGEYTALDIMAFVFKKGDNWDSDQEAMCVEFRCDICDGIMPKEIEEKVVL